MSVSGVLLRGQRVLRRLARAARSRWRRSLLLRVVAATLALGILVLLIVGQLLLQAISDGLVDSARTAAQNDATQQTQNTIFSHRTQKFEDEIEFRTWTAQKLNDLHGPDDAPLRFVALLKALGTSPGPITDQGLGVVPSAIPNELRSKVVASNDQLITQVLTLPVRDASGGMTEQGVIAVGSALDLGPLGAGADEQGHGRYELYFVYPLDREVAILAIVQRTFLVGAVALLLLIGLVAWVVTRQVVDPVRQAAQAAEQLAAGHLDRADAGARRGRPGPARSVLQRDGRQPGTPDPPAGGAVPGAAAVRLRRLPRAAHPADHDPDGRRGDLRGPGRVRPRAGADLGAAADPARPLRVAALRPARDQPVRRRRRGARAGSRSTSREVVHRVVEHLRPLAERKGSRITVHDHAASCVAEVDAAAGRTDPAQPARQRHRARRGPAGRGHGRDATTRPSRSASATTASACGRPRSGWSSTGSGAPTRPARARTGGTGLGLSIALEDAHLHGGWLQAWGEPGAGAHFRLTLPRYGGAILAGSPLPLVPADAPAAMRSGMLSVPERA